MTTMTTTRTTVERTVTRRLRRAAMIGAALATAIPAPATGLAAQEPVCEGRVVGGLGVTGLRCRDCTFTSNDGAIVRARFGTEPEVLHVQVGSPLRPGDVLVAVDGHLITTREGAGRLTALRPGEVVEVRVRRDGRTQVIPVRATEVCRSDVPAPLAPTAPLPPVQGVPSLRAPAVPPIAPLPPPAASPVLPLGRLGFSFDCSRCHFDSSDGIWRFDAPPRVQRVETNGPADGRLRAGDELLAVNGHALTTSAGGDAFASIEAGDEVAWTVSRDGQEIRVVTVAEAKVEALTPSVPPIPSIAPLPSPADLPISDVLRYVGTHGPAHVEVRGQPISVTLDDDEELIIIRTPGNEIRIRIGAGG